MFSALAWFAAASKSPAYDEPYHAISAWLQFRYGDFRIDNEDPPLWQYWASIPNSRGALKADFTGSMWKSIPQELIHQWYWGVQTLYRTAGNDAVGLIRRCRAMMLICGVGLGVLICLWSWRMGGAVAAVVAGFAFCLDPNFLAHSPLMKNDVAFAMSMFGLAMVLWRAGQNLSVESIVWIAVLSLITLTVKFSGIVAVMLVPLLLGARALLPTPWPALGSLLTSRLHRMLIAVGVTLLAALFSYAGIWAVYGFRFRPTPQKDVWLNLTELTDQVRTNEMIIACHGSPPPGAKPGPDLTWTARAVVYANKHGLLPQAFLGGFLFTYCSALVRYSYLCGQISQLGWWWYFPFAILVKTPIATLIAIAGTAILGARAMLHGRFKTPDRRWFLISLIVPPALLLGVAMSSNLNIGLRHVMAIYPFAFVAIGQAAAALWRAHRLQFRFAITGLGILLAVETLSVFPNYMAFFNVAAARAPGGKLALLGDSNLDWGQDLLLLAQWQREHPKETMYLSYFGYADPAYFGIKYIPLPGGYHYDPPPHWPDPYSRCVIAISASNLQGFLEDPKLRNEFYNKWKNRKPSVILGDSIYLFEYDVGREK